MVNELQQLTKETLAANIISESRTFNQNFANSVLSDPVNTKFQTIAGFEFSIISLDPNNSHEMEVIISRTTGGGGFTPIWTWAFKTSDGEDVSSGVIRAEELKGFVINGATGDELAISINMDSNFDMQITMEIVFIQKDI